MTRYRRAEVLKRLSDKLESGRIIVAAGAGTGISARFEEEGGADLLLVFNSGRYRMHGLGSLSGLMAYGDANAIALEMGERQILPIVKEVPVLCSVNGTDPTRVMENFLGAVSAAGFSGVNNFPTVGLIDGNFRRELEQTGMGYDKEVAMIALAHRLDLFTAAYAFSPDEAARMAGAGCDVLLAHVGLTAGGAIGAGKTLTLSEAASRIGAMMEASRKVSPRIIVLCHGGPIASPEDVRAVLEEVPVQGFVGASSMERLPVEKGIRETTAAFAAIALRG
ncbi:MAG TPA: phosphoenolpyruvate hydrolase family protein [Anaeromyxobacteraceae bacterium]|nr:phosphoenolpyruvate hydrolase family protein [Anaeromyxobacteraceae bacterium]